MVQEKLAYDDVITYTQRGKGIEAELNVIAVSGIHTPAPGHLPSSLSN